MKPEKIYIFFKIKTGKAKPGIICTLNSGTRKIMKSLDKKDYVYGILSYCVKELARWVKSQTKKEKKEINNE